MNKIYRFFITALVVTSALASCSKEAVGPDAEPGPGCEEDNVRIISVSYVGTKAHLSGLEPKFEGGEVIKISNGSGIEECTVREEGWGNYVITTKLPGTLTAVFPASAAIISGNEITGVDTSVEDSQTGYTGDVMNYVSAIATIAPGATTATFQIQQAIFRIDYWYGRDSFTVNSLRTVVDGARIGEKKQIATTASGTPAYTITIENTNITTYYAVIEPGVNLSDLSFDIKSNYNGNTMKGIPLSKIAPGTDQTVAGGYYVIDDTNWHPYVEIGGLKWATMNIGASSPTERGQYFAWAGTVGQTYSGSSFSPGFTISNAPYYSGGKYTKYTSSDSKSVLDLSDDAAYVNWGGPWRMPTGEPSTGELVKMWNSGFMAWDSGTNKGYYYFVPSEIGKSAGRGYLTDVSDAQRSLAKLFFPAVGASGTSTDLGEPEVCHYWSSSCDYQNDSAEYAYYIKAAGTGTSGMYLIPEKFSRYKGRPVRPVAEIDSAIHIGQGLTPYGETDWD